jgi:hypothetical protein
MTSLLSRPLNCSAHPRVEMQFGVVRILGILWNILGREAINAGRS